MCALCELHLSCVPRWKKDWEMLIYILLGRQREEMVFFLWTYIDQRVLISPFSSPSSSSFYFFRKGNVGSRTGLTSLLLPFLGFVMLVSACAVFSRLASWGFAMTSFCLFKGTRAWLSLLWWAGLSNLGFSIWWPLLAQTYPGLSDKSDIESESPAAWLSLSFSLLWSREETRVFLIPWHLHKE